MMSTTQVPANTLILYSSVDGQTLKIINRIKQSIEGEVTVINVDDKLEIDFTLYNKVLVGASIRYGNFRKNMINFVNQHKQQLDALPNAFFVVCLTARKPEKAVPENNAYMKKFEQLSAWQPQHKAVFAGALLYSRYNWWQTLLIQLIMKMTGGSTDKTQDMELTDWQKVEQFGEHFNRL
ncbi:menaquinone-dependent protoporphyrinogen IX dehydrogenase [Psychromonas sp. 14N.309.X.WAT.B.A12]|uniref:menaquinone-dependent protoporphyrinogen IX dehydrogenase n=1 Tax=Psychromonas sp. 14N.309.X.WAT.B.A12 TaxID=2998322 RepID=UPI0025B22970|nr:menaquinone-dependent protoporphyrinogen IX dehydrogenase [Psychromonas sp. 14N.309.X.WAT.B.A12]MDN2664070.1 menaquinone-dependent protoporphyrinogen IX dehydrogenase [Psychromonas sp. 14N.309.X.WAT.B.A12]